jgi:hypothetical protein
MIMKQLTALFAEVCITVLGAMALTHGLDGAIFASCVGALAGLGGYYISSTKTPK